MGSRSWRREQNRTRDAVLSLTCQPYVFETLLLAPAMQVAVSEICTPDALSPLHDCVRAMGRSPRIGDIPKTSLALADGGNAALK